MKPNFNPLATALAASLQLAVLAAVPIAWTNAPGMPPHMPPPVPHGSKVEFSVTLKGFTDPAISADADVRLWYQTNGMGSAWFSAPATFASNVITAAFGPAQDTGADRVNCFFGAPSNVFASAVLRLSHAPGFTPSMIDLPPKVIDFGSVELRNIHALTNGWTFGKEVDLTPSTNYTDRTLGAFAETGTVERARSYGTPTRWTDATGCVWEISRAWNFQNLLLYTPSGEMQWTATECLRDGYDWSSYAGYWLRYDAQGTNWIAHTDLYDTGDVSSSGLLDDDVVEIDGWGTFRAVYVTNLVGRVAMTSDIPHAVSNVVTKSYVEGLGIESGIQEETDPVWSSEKSNYATKTELGTVEGKADAAALDASSALRIVLGESVWFAVTNYMRTAAGVIPSLQLWEVRDGATNLVYDSREEITNTVRALTTELRTELESRIPSKAWGNYQSDGTDNPQPGEVAIINPPTIILTGGGTFNKYIEVGDSSVWVLQSSGPVSFGGNTNGNFFAVRDDEGNTHFKVAKTDSYDLPMFISDILPRQSQNHILIYTATTNRQGNAVAQPVLFAANDLKNSTWHEEVEGEIDALGLTVSWAKDETIPAWVATITPDVWYEKMFFRAKVTQEGGVAVINTAPVRFDGGVQIGNGTYRLVPYTTGGKTYLTVEGMP